MNRNMMQQLQKMQQEMAKAQDEIQNAVVEGAAAGGAVKVKMSGDFKVTNISLERGIVDPEDIETLEDVIVAALNDARAKAEEYSTKRMSAVTGGLKIPGM